MEAACILAFVGAVIGAGAGLLWKGVDLVLGYSTMTADVFGGCVLIGAVLTPPLCLLACIMSERN